MTYSESKLMWRKIKVILIMLVLVVAVIGARFILVPMIEKEIAAANDVLAQGSKVSSTLQEIENLQYVVDSSGKEFIDLNTNKDNYVKALGLLCDANKLNIHKMTVDDVVADASGLSSMSVALELQGDLKNVKDFVDDIFNSELLCRIDSVSYRLEDNAFAWMWRAVDDSNVVEWWDISSVDGYLLTDSVDPMDQTDLYVLDANAFMKHDTALCYMEVQFIGAEG